MSFNDELDILSADTMGLLADETIVITRIRPTGDLDPVSFARVTTVTPPVSVPAVSGEPERFRDQGGGWLVRNTFTVAVDAVGFRPSREGTLTDKAGRPWNIVECRDSVGGREYEIHAQRIA